MSGGEVTAGADCGGVSHGVFEWVKVKRICRFVDATRLSTGSSTTTETCRFSKPQNF
jgi:hypothetical protein